MPATLQTPTATRRAYAGGPKTIREADQSVEVVVATSAAVYTRQGGFLTLEALVLSGVNLPAQVPLLDSHKRDSLENVLGSVRDLRIEGDKIIGRIYLADVEESTWNKIRQGHITDTSAGYRAIEAERIPRGTSRVVNGRSYTAPAHRDLDVVTKWRLLECSLVAIGADPKTKIRSYFPLHERNHAMVTQTRTRRENLADLANDQLRIAGGEMRWPDLARSLLRQAGERLPENDQDMIRAAMSSADVSAAITSTVENHFIEAYQRVPDTTSPWVGSIAASDFKQFETYLVDKSSRLQRLPRGGTAEDADFSVQGATMQVGRYASKFTLDEQDLTDGASISLQLIVVAELARAAATLKPDLVYALILSNPTAPDGTALFHANHGNSGTAAIGSDNIAAGMAAIAGQTTTDAEGDPIHLGLSAKYCIVPPALVGNARIVARSMALGDDTDLEVRSESRIGSTGVVDPASDTIREGSDTQWLLMSAGQGSPSIVCAALNGDSTPKLRRYNLRQGQWGVGWDINLDLAAACVDWKSIYRSTGVA